MGWDEEEQKYMMDEGTIVMWKVFRFSNKGNIVLRPALWSLNTVLGDLLSLSTILLLFNTLISLAREYIVLCIIYYL